MMHLLIGLGPCPLGALRVCYQAGKNNDASTYIGLGPCPLGALRVCYQSGKDNDGSSYRVRSLSPRSPFGANEKGLKDEGLGFGFHVSSEVPFPI